ncbi:MAG: polyprenyl synthetase family protein [Acidimicrobiales bacterium]
MTTPLAADLSKPGPAAPLQLTAVAAAVDARLDAVLAHESGRWKAVDPRLGEAVDELRSVVGSGGKRFRAAFCYWAWRGRSGCRPWGDDPPAALASDPGAAVALDAAAGFELLQAFALIHDDIMDDSDTRRGRPTVHQSQAGRLAEHGWRGEPRRFGEGVAILIGDLSHAYADRMMAGVSPAGRAIWDDLRIELNLGQYLDLRSAASAELDAVTAHRVSTFKSAMYTIVRPLQLGASLDGPADPALLTALDRFGRPLGRAFQLKDDLLGVLGNEARLGKPVGDDLREGKPTELLALALERATPAQRSVLAGIGRRDLSADQVAAIVEVFTATEAVAEIDARMTALVANAVAMVDELPYPADTRAALVALAGYVASRTS